MGNVWSIFVFGLKADEFEYAYALDGPYDPQHGLLFDKKRILLDPYARAITGQSRWGVQLSDDSFYKARVVHDDFIWNVPRQKMAPLQDCVIYELHVRGFTQHESAGVTHRGTFAGIMEKIPYLQDLGINAVELMPVFEFDETRGMREVNGETLLDYWGYNPVSFFAPNTSYSAEVEYNREGTELKKLIRSLHDHGIRVIFDVVSIIPQKGMSAARSSHSKGSTTMYITCSRRMESITISAAAAIRSTAIIRWCGIDPELPALLDRRLSCGWIPL